jgi:branched-chain amino acid transport system permease protein
VARPTVGASAAVGEVPTGASYSSADVVFRPRWPGIAARVLAAVVIAAGILVQPLLWDNLRDQWLGLAAIYAVIGLSVNVITGHSGQISLGHQAFVGIGAFMSAFVAAKLGGYFPDPENLVLPPLTVPSSNFWLGVVAAAATGAVMALLLGVVALRIRGLYLALITLAFGLMAEQAIFGIRGFTGGGAGLMAPRPAMFESNQAYAYVCFGFVGLLLFVDWRLVRSKAGRAIVAIRNDEQVAATQGINVIRYKLLAFAISGLMAGLAGALFAHWNQAVQALDFVLQTALLWILMSVVGGLGSRAGVVIGSVFFALFPLVVSDRAGDASIPVPFIGDVLVQTLTPFLGALLLLLTITQYPGGIGQQILPIRRWLAGGPLVEHRRQVLLLPGLPAVVVAAAGVLAGWELRVWLVAAVATAVVTGLLLALYLRRYHRTKEKMARSKVGREARPDRVGPPEEAAEPSGEGDSEATVPISTGDHSGTAS